MQTWSWRAAAALRSSSMSTRRRSEGWAGAATLPLGGQQCAGAPPRQVGIDRQQHVMPCLSCSVPLFAHLLRPFPLDVAYCAPVVYPTAACPLAPFASALGS